MTLQDITKALKKGKATLRERTMVYEKVQQKHPYFWRNGVVLGYPKDNEKLLPYFFRGLE